MRRHRSQCIDSSRRFRYKFFSSQTFQSTSYFTQAKTKEEFISCVEYRKSSGCICGCQRVKGDPLPLCLGFDDMHFLGSTTNLFFLFAKLVIAISVIYAAISGVFSIATSFLASSSVTHSCITGAVCIISAYTSIENKQNNEYQVAVEMWIGVGITVIVCTVLRIAKLKAKILDINIDKDMLTPSDLAMKLENLPYGNYNEQEVLDMLLQKQIDIPLGINETRQPILYKSIHIVYNMQGVRQLIQQAEQQCATVSQMYQSSSGQLNVAEKDYIQSKLRLLETLESLQDVRKKFMCEDQYRRTLASTCCIVTFKNQQSQKKFISRYGQAKFGIVDQIKAWWNRVVLKQPNKSQLFKGNFINIQRAPEPEDILWENSEKVYSLSRIIVIWSITLTIVLISFGIVVGLDYIQLRLTTDPSLRQNFDNTLEIINYAISVVLIIVNNILWVAIMFLIKIQYSHTISERVISQTNKTIIAQSINSIILPIIVNLVLQDKLFGKDGLVIQIFDYSLSNCLLPVILVYIDIPYFIKKFFLWFRCTRNKIINYLSRSEEVEPDQNYVINVNRFYEGGDINITASYVYLTGGLMYAVFNSWLQPVILIILFVGTLLFYHIKKYLLLRRYQAPEMLSKLVFDNVLMSLNYVPIFHALGGLLLTLFIFNVRLHLFVPSCVSLLLALINLRNPYGIFDKIIAYIHKLCSRKSLVHNGNSQTQKNLKTTPAQQMNIINDLNNHETNHHNNNTPTDHEDMFKGNLQYYHYNHLSTLLGYQYLLRGQNAGQMSAVKRQIKIFTESFINQGNQKFDYPKECESATNDDMLNQKDPVKSF